MNVTHVVLVKYVNDVHLETTMCFYTIGEDRARSLASTINSKRTIMAPGERPPYVGRLIESVVVGDVSWARL
jgi:hypothetical protein